MAEKPLLIAGEIHHHTRVKLKDGDSILRSLPGVMRFMLGQNKWDQPFWTRFVRSVDDRVFENATVREWLYSEPFKGVGTNPKTLRALLGACGTEGHAVIDLLRQQGCDLGPDPDAQDHLRFWFAQATPEQQVAFLREIGAL